MQPGEFFGELALLDGKERSADAKAMTDCTLAILNRRDVLQFLPSAALSDGLHAVLLHGQGVPIREALTLLVWAALAVPAAARWFRWE